MRLKNKRNEQEITCPYCHQRVIPKREINRVKSEFIGGRYTRKDKLSWLICPRCKKILQSE